MEDLKIYNHRRLFADISGSDLDFLRWLHRLGVAYSPDADRVCIYCDAGMTIEFGECMRFRCSRKGCRRKIGYFVDTFFENSHLTAKEIFQFSYYWAWEQADTAAFMHEFRREDGSTLGEHTITDWKSFLREICAEYFLRNPVKIGGLDEDGQTRVVEIDETMITRRKYNRGHAVGGQWLFGGVERGSSGKRCFLVACPPTADIPQGKRDAATLLPIIQDYILPGSIIMSDMWGAYIKIDRLPENYLHLTVNHKIQFVNPESGACTNTVEGMWQHFKRAHKSRYGTARTLLDSYLPEFMWRKCFKGEEVFFNLWSQIADCYPLQA